MAKQKFKDFVPRPKPKKRPGRHAKSKSKRIPNKKKYKGEKIADLIISSSKKIKHHSRINIQP